MQSLLAWLLVREARHSVYTGSDEQHCTGTETTRTINDCHDGHDNDVVDNSGHDNHNLIDRNACPQSEVQSTHSMSPAGLLPQAGGSHSRLELNADMCIQVHQTGLGQPEAAWQLQCHPAASKSGPGP